jgi:uncharacterized protein
MLNLTRRLLIVIGFSLSGLSSAASFDCTKASSPYEKAVCSNPNLSSLDEQLAGAYKDARAKSADPDSLKKEQIEWIKSTRQCASDVGCIEKAYKTRIASLGSTASAPPTTKPASPQEQYQAMVNRSINELGPSGYAKCAAATVTMVALKARGDNLGRLAPQIDPMSKFMGAVRAGLISRGTPANTLDTLIRASDKVIMSDPDPVLRGMKDFDKCYNDAVR